MTMTNSMAAASVSASEWSTALGDGGELQVGGDELPGWDGLYSYAYGLARRALRSRRVQTADAEDCLQDIWVVMLSRRPPAGWRANPKRRPRR